MRVERNLLTDAGGMPGSAVRPKFAQWIDGVVSTGIDPCDPWLKLRDVATGSATGYWLESCLHSETMFNARLARRGFD